MFKKIICFLCLCSSLFGYCQQNTPLFIAHRGGISSEFPENSLMAFQHCMDTDVAMIETDVRVTKDGKMVLFHDASLLRMMEISEKIENYTLAQLQELSLGKHQKIPTLEQALSLLETGTIKLLLDIKATVDYSKIYSLLEKHHMKERTYVGVRSLADLKTCKSLDVRVNVLGFIPSADHVDDFVFNNVNAIRLWPKWLLFKPSLLAEVVNKEIPVWMTVGDMKTDEIKKWYKQGVQGFIHDTPIKIQSSF